MLSPHVLVHAWVHARTLTVSTLDPLYTRLAVDIRSYGTLEGKPRVYVRDDLGRIGWVNGFLGECPVIAYRYRGVVATACRNIVDYVDPLEL